jgi:hypothetical protein
VSARPLFVTPAVKRMHSSPAIAQAAAALLLLASAPLPARALVKFNDGHDEIFLSATAGLTYDSNLFATPQGEGDTSFDSALLIEYRRRAGMIGVDASAGWDFSKFANNSSEDFANPHVALELSKGSGRTTGTLKAAAKKENRADTAINIRTESWDYQSGLDIKYPVIERYSLTGTLGYELRDFKDNAALVDITTYSAGAGLNYALSSQRDLVVAYRYRTTDTTVRTTDVDNALTFGVSGRILPKFTGSAHAGLQRREIDRLNTPSEGHNSVTAAVSVLWTLTSRLGLNGTIARDFATVATDASVDTTTVGLDAQFALNPKTAAFAGVGYGHLSFLDTAAAGRKDDYGTLSAGVSHTYTERLKLSITYLFTENWSTAATSDYTRHAVLVSASTRW